MTINTGCHQAIQTLLEHLDQKALKARNLSWVDDDAYLFAGRQPDRAISVPTLNNLVKLPAVEGCSRNAEVTAGLRYMPGLARCVLKDPQPPGDQPFLF